MDIRAHKKNLIGAFIWPGGRWVTVKGVILKWNQGLDYIIHPATRTAGVRDEVYNWLAEYYPNADREDVITCNNHDNNVTTYEGNIVNIETFLADELVKNRQWVESVKQ